MPEIVRRDFLKLVGVSAGGAAAAGCADHVEKLIPYVVQPEETTPGHPVVYASTCGECPVGCGVHVITREGRPIKLEGNPEHPVNRGKLCARSQASIERTYSPDRFSGPMRRGSSGELEPVSWDEALATVTDAIRKAPAGTHILGGDPGDTANGLVDRVAAAIGAGGRTVYEAFSGETLRQATERLFGSASEPVFDLSGADLVIDFGSELLDTGLSPVEHQGQWSAARNLTDHPDGGAKLVYVGSRLSLTASSSDEWLPARPGSEGILALALARVAVETGAGGGIHNGLLAGVLAGVDVASAAEECDLPADAIARVGRALAHAKGAVALPPGVAVASRRAVGATAAVLLLNHVLGATGSRMKIPAADDSARGRARYKDLLSLIQAMQGGAVGVLLVHHANPLYSVPRSAGLEAALEKVGLVVSFASAADETTAKAHLVLPDHGSLERWGDGRPRSGVRSLTQPSFRPLYDTRAFGDTLLELGRAAGGTGLPTGNFQSLLEAAWADQNLREAQKRGGVYGPVVEAELNFAPDSVEVAAPILTGDGNLALLPIPHGLLGDGTGAALSLLQEIPDPITSVAWDSWAEISLATAERLGVDPGDVLTVTTSAGSLEVAAYPRGGIRDDVIAIPIGQGHTVGHFASKAGQGMPGTKRGVNVADLLPGDGVDERGARAWLTEKASVSASGRFRRLSMLQWSDNQRGRQLGESISLVALAGGGDADHAAPADGHGAAPADGHGGAEEHGGGHGESHEIILPYDPADDAADQEYEDTFRARGERSIKASDYRWGLNVDLDRCTGCSACIAACYVENNIPRVGEDETRLVRQMAWLRIDRWVGDGVADLHVGRVHPADSRERLGDVDVRNAPMMCQQCGAAPCEPVCPVIATYHNEEGLNAMVYNRCIGTRYCANNCPYKVRRFNYFDNQLTKWPEPMELGLNPDVTVRGQGVMEKCTFCVQRIQYARQDAKSRGEQIADGAVQTACQQTCPSGAITFGNLRDDSSAVSKQADDSKRGYHALHVLNTRPAVTYLAKVVRGPVEG